MDMETLIQEYKDAIRRAERQRNVLREMLIDREMHRLQNLTDVVVAREIAAARIDQETMDRLQEHAA